MFDLILKELKGNPYKMICAAGGLLIYGGLMYLGSNGKPLNEFKEFINNLND